MRWGGQRARVFRLFFSRKTISAFLEEEAKRLAHFIPMGDPIRPENALMFSALVLR
jgi:hypothetical protein